MPEDRTHTPHVRNKKYMKNVGRKMKVKGHFKHMRKWEVISKLIPDVCILFNDDFSVTHNM
jgi:hypothetical protein